MESVEIGNMVADPATYADDRIYHSLFARLRRENPVMWVEPDNHRPFWLVTKHADVREIERQFNRFVNRSRTFLLTREEDERIAKKPGGTITRSLIQLDEPDHRVYRSVTQSWFMPKNIETLEARIRPIASRFVDRLVASNGAADFVADIAVWYPLRVILTILGIPEEDDAQVLHWTQKIFGADGPESDAGGRLATIEKAFAEIGHYFNDIAARMRVDPQDDIASVIANATVNGAPLTELETNSYYLTLITAGHDTTSSTLAGGLLALIQNPTELAKLRRDPARLRPAVDEFLRWTTPIKHFFRAAVEDYEIRGRKISAGEHLMMCYPSANRDEEVFEDAFSFRIDRDPNPHMAFGYGPHTCLGMHLAKLELRVFFEELLSRVEQIELAGDPVWTRSSFVQGLSALPIRYRAKSDAPADQVDEPASARTAPIATSAG